MGLRVAVFLGIALLTSTADARGRKAEHASETPREESFAVLEPVLTGLPDSMASRVRSTVRSYVEDSLKLKLIARKTMAKKVSSAQLKGLAACGAKVCADAKEIGGKLEADRIVLIAMSGTEDSFQLQITAFNAHTGNVSGRGLRVLRTAAEIEENARDLTHYVLTHETRDAKGYLRISCAEAGATVSVDGDRVGTTPISQASPLKPGAHTVHIEKPGFVAFDTHVNIEAGRDAEVEAKLDAVQLEAIQAPPPVEEVKAPPPPPPERSMSLGRKLGLASTIAGGATLAAGLVLGLLANSHDTHVSTTKQSGAAVQSEVNTANSQASAANVLFGVGGGVSALGVTIMVVF